MSFEFDIPFYMLVGIYFIQVVVISFYSPWVIRRYYLKLVELYPPAEYPHLNLVSPELLKGKRPILRHLEAFIGIVGLLAITASLLFWQKDMPNLVLRDFLHPLFVISSYCGIQLVPTLIITLWQRKILKQFRDMKLPTRRSAILQRLKITDYISPALVVFGLATTSTTLILSAYWLLNAMGPRDLMISVAIINAIMLSLLLHRTFWVPQFKRTDPFISHDDLFRQRKRQLDTLFRGWGFGALIFLTIAAGRVGIFGSNTNLSYGFAMICLLFIAQSLYLSWGLARLLDQTDFSVYRAADNPAKPGDSSLQPR